MTFINNPLCKPEINHKDGSNKSNNCIENLEWVTTSENQQHAIANKLYQTARGEKSGQSKLKESQVREIHRMYSSGEYTQQDIADLFKIQNSQVSRIITGVRWKHIYDELNGDSNE